ncbi:MAG: FeoB-associated Cys-rich membrane protein [Desulfonatronovibrionaceae bacterium]
MQKAIVVLIIIVAAFFILRRFFRALYADPGESCGCSGCSGCPSQGVCDLEESPGLPDKKPDSVEKEFRRQEQKIRAPRGKKGHIK